MFGGKRVERAAVAVRARGGRGARAAIRERMLDVLAAFEAEATDIDPDVDLEDGHDAELVNEDDEPWKDCSFNEPEWSDVHGVFDPPIPPEPASIVREMDKVTDALAQIGEAVRGT